MRKFFVFVLVPLLVLSLVAFGIFQILKYSTKQYSPCEVVQYTENDYDLEVAYCRPFKKGRTIFGGLVPYGEVWRTGANEPTTFKTETDLYILGQKLPAGEYTLWTIPNIGEWKVIFNSGNRGWGINFDGEATRDSTLDVVKVSVNPKRSFMVYEQFTIFFDHEPLRMMLQWDFTRVDVPLKLHK